MMRGRKKKGYIGVTSRDPKNRWKEHYNSESDLGTKMREQGQTVEDMHVLHEGVPGHEARKLEQEYRPEPNMGWNRAPGGASIKDDEIYSVYQIPPKRRVKPIVQWAMILAFILLGVIFLWP